MDLQQYYLQMQKYGYHRNQMYMPPLPMTIPKYTSAQNTQMMKNSYYQYSMMQPSMNIASNNQNISNFAQPQSSTTNTNTMMMMNKHKQLSQSQPLSGLPTSKLRSG